MRQGSGKVVLLVHGWGDSAAGLANIYNDLSQKYDVIAPDLPGFGGSEIPKNQPWHIDNYVNIIQHFLLKLGANELYTIIGHSNGGAIAIWGTANSVFYSQKLILLASSGVRETKQKPFAKKLAFSAGKTFSKILPKKTQNKLRKNVYKHTGSDIFVAPQLEQTFRVIVAQDVREESKKIILPTLLLYGHDDTATPLRYGEIFKNNIAGSRLVIIENAAHFIHLDQPNVVLKEINEFLSNE